MNVDAALNQIARHGFIDRAGLRPRTAIALIRRGFETFQLPSGSLVLAAPAKGRNTAGWKLVTL